MKTSKFLIILFLTTLATMISVHAQAQIGPDLVPPGLEPNHPLDSYTMTGSKKLVDDWRYEASWELNANDVVFSAAKKRQLISEAPSTIHVITDKDIAAHGWRSLAEILRFVPGVQTMTTKSQFQSVMIRGLVGTEDNNSRILWLQNGVPMNDVRDSGIWLDETYPVEMIKRIEVVLGPGSALYGSGAFQGVVNIFTKDPADIEKYGEYRVTLQNNMTFKASAIAAYNSDNQDFGILGHVSGNTTQGPGLIGDYTYTKYAMEQANESIKNNKAPDLYRYENLDSNSDKHWYNADLKLHYKAFKWNLGFTDIYAGADGSEFVLGVSYKQPTYQNGLEGIVDKNASDFSEVLNYRFNRREAYTDLIYEDDFGESVSFLALLSYRFNHYNHKHYNNFNTSEEADIFNSLVCSDNVGQACNHNFDKKIDYDTYQHKLYALAQVQWRIYEANELIAGVVAEYQHINSPDFINATSYTTKDDGTNTSLNATKLGQVTPSVFIQDEQRFWNDRIILTAGARFDAYRIYMSGDKDPDYAPSWRFAFLSKWTDWMTMRLSYGYSFKEPSLYQLYIDTFDYAGNPNLNPEKLHNIELSFLFNPTYYMKIRLDGFATIMDDLIIMQYQSNFSDSYLGIKGRYTPIQEDGAQIFGFELSLDTSIGNNWSLYSHYNFLYSKREYSIKNLSSDNTSRVITANIDNLVPDDAMHRIKLGATYMNDYLTADLAGFLVAGTPKTKSNSGWASRFTYKTPTYFILQPQITVNLGANIGLMFEGSYAFSEGLLDSPTYRFYYEKEGVPVNRYSLMLSLMYPFRK